MNNLEILMDFVILFGTNKSNLTNGGKFICFHFFMCHFYYFPLHLIKYTNLYTQHKFILDIFQMEEIFH